MLGGGLYKLQNMGIMEYYWPNYDGPYPSYPSYDKPHNERKYYLSKYSM